MLKRKNPILQLVQFLALVASLLIAGQIVYTLVQGAPLCLNGGCLVVEKLSKVSPLVFNGVGLVFFQTIYWGVRAARGERRRLPGFVSMVLLAGLAVEGVLVSSQALIGKSYCFYCLGVLGFVVLLNLLLGLRQVVMGVLIFASVVAAFASLELPQNVAGKQAFTEGVFATRQGVLAYPQHYLFYASTCTHCEKVIASLRLNRRVSISFNPIDQVSAIDLPQAQIRPQYTAALNKGLLTSLGIEEIPVLLTKTVDGWTIRQGESSILAYLNAPTSPPTGTSGQSGSAPAAANPQAIPGLSDGCSVATDCSSSAAGSSSSGPGSLLPAPAAGSSR